MSDLPYLDRYLQRVVDRIVSLESDQPLRKSISILVKIFGVITLVIAIIPDVIWTVLFSSQAHRSPDILVLFSSIMLLLWILVSIIMGAIFISLFWNRSNKIRDFSGESHFTLLPISVVLIRLFGEGGFILFIGIGIKLFMLLILMTIPQMIIPQLMRTSPDFEGVVKVSITIGGLVLGSVVLLIVSYFVAELVNLFTSMGTNLKKIETQLSAKEDASGS